MAVGIRYKKKIICELGHSSFLFAFFSTVSANLETAWGERFPVLMHDFFDAELEQNSAAAALAELDIIADELSRLSVDRVIWDIDDRTKRPPWGDDIAGDITSLANYFVTADGDDLIATIRKILQKLHGRGGIVRIVNC